MSDVTASIDQRTRLAGRKRLQLLVFRLNGGQLYGINVFKIREVLPCPKSSSIPQSLPVLGGIANICGRTICIMDLATTMEVRLARVWKQHS